MEIVDVVRRLIGPIDPIGETHADDKRFANLRDMTELVDGLLSDIDRVATNKSHSEFSRQRAGKHAFEFFNSIGISN